MVDKRYELFCLADKLFYDSPPATIDTDFDISHRALPAGWKQVRGQEWTLYVTPGHDIQTQGWKVHASGSVDSAEQVLEHCWDYCMANGIEFKHLRGAGALRLRNAKYAPRGASGKLVTIYAGTNLTTRRCTPGGYRRCPIAASETEARRLIH